MVGIGEPVFSPICSYATKVDTPREGLRDTMSYPLQAWPGGPHPGQIAAMQAQQAYLVAMERRRRIAFLLLYGPSSQVVNAESSMGAQAGRADEI